MGRYFSGMPTGALLYPLFALILLSGCSSKTMVVLVPDPSGKTGAVTVSNPAGTVGIETANQATTIADQKSAPSAPVLLEQQEIDRVFSRALKAQPAPPVHFLLYFVSDSNELTTDSLNSLPAVMQTIKERNSIDISIVGHTDTIGSKEYNYTLSKSRADAVASLLVSRGIQQAHLRTTSHGEENPLVKTGDNANEPKNRRVEVVVR